MGRVPQIMPRKVYRNPLASAAALPLAPLSLSLSVRLSVSLSLPACLPGPLVNSSYTPVFLVACGAIIGGTVGLCPFETCVGPAQYGEHNAWRSFVSIVNATARVDR